MVLPWGAVTVAALAALVSGCVRANLVDCGNGQLCPEGRACVSLAENASLVCAEPDQLAACAELDEDAPCEVEGQAPSSCQGGVCLPIACGNGLIDFGEICDDGNTVAGDNTCSADCRSTEVCGNAVVDPLVLVAGTPRLDEQCDDGNLRSGDGCSSQCTLEALRWRRRDVAPTPRTGALMVYDVRRGRLLMFGGKGRDAADQDVFDDGTYDWTGTSWRRLPTLTSPPGREGHMLAYDPTRGRVVMFGGSAGSQALGDLWELDGNVWMPRTTASGPAARAGAAMQYDSVRRRVVLFGGGNDDLGLLNDTWEWDGTTWTERVLATRPSPRSFTGSAYDPRRGRLVIAGGFDGAGPLRDTWSLDGAGWTYVTEAPVNLVGSVAMTFDPARDQLVAWGGTSTFELLDATWMDLAQAQPGVRIAAAIGTDPVTQEVVLFGGSTSAGLSASTWRWNGSVWTPVLSVTPEPRQLPSAAFDPQAGAMWMFGGGVASTGVSDELFALSRAGWRDMTSVGPSARLAAGLAYDTRRRTLVLFGGSTNNSALAPAETWVHDGASWRLATPTRSPSPRAQPGMVYDSRRDRVVLFGGVVSTTESISYLDDTWEWDGADWTQVTTPNRPSARGNTLVFDDARGVVVLAGGFRFPETANDVWEYDGVTWQQVQPVNPFAQRVFHAIAYEPTMQRTWLYGGGQITGGSIVSDTWQWGDDGWQQLLGESPPGVLYHVGFRAPLEPAFASFAGQAQPGINTDALWTLQYENTERREQCVLDIDEDGDGRAGCADQDCWARCTPLCPPGAPCDPAAPRCGDGVCNPALENCRLCASDCACTPTCGDSFCDSGETLAACPGDCTP